MDVTAAPQPEIVNATELVQEWRSGSAGGFFAGAPLTVPEGFVAVVVLRGEALDLLLPGAYTLDAARLPLLALKARLEAGGKKPIPASIFLVRTGQPGWVSWESELLLSQSRATGMVVNRVSGRVTFRVHDARRFLQGLFSAARASKAQPKSFQLSLGSAPVTGPGEVAGSGTAALVANGVGEIAAGAIAGRPVAELTAPGALERLGPAVEHAISQGMLDLGLVALGTAVDAVSPPELAPCAGCGRSDRSRAFAIFRWTVSLFYIRFHGQRGGNFCIPCGLPVCLGYTALALVMGWWGIIGLVLTPVFLAMNLYNLGGLLLKQRTAPPADTASSR
ncbi:MAG TPA: SPFH domain-containing protein [Armatimonadota bacterium]|nr:SPFH domain-containing protein [Armatimonadota bacterium]